MLWNDRGAHSNVQYAFIFLWTLSYSTKYLLNTLNLIIYIVVFLYYTSKHIPYLSYFSPVPHPQAAPQHVFCPQHHPSCSYLASTWPWGGFSWAVSIHSLSSGIAMILLPVMMKSKSADIKPWWSWLCWSHPVPLVDTQHRYLCWYRWQPWPWQLSGGGRGVWPDGRGGDRAGEACREGVLPPVLQSTGVLLLQGKNLIL